MEAPLLGTPVVMGRGRRETPLGALARGALVGAAGIGAMDSLWYWRYRRGGGKDGPLSWEFSTEVKDWDQVSAPGQVGRRLVEGLFRVKIPDEAAGVVNDVMHWAYGLGWGGLYGLVAGSLPRARPLYGLAFGPTVWATSYVVLPLAKLYEPIWDYDAATLWKDLSAHLAYGLAVAGAFPALRGPASRP